jgi:four helix bundle protein
MQDFRKLAVFHKARALVSAVYRATASFPREETYGLTSQIRRAAISIVANLAEGCGRTGDTELRRFCDISMGSASELELLLKVASDLKYLGANSFQELSSQNEEVKRMLARLICPTSSAAAAR